MRNRFQNLATVIFLSMLVTGCAAPTKIVTNKAQTYTSEPKRVFVVDSMGTDFGREFTNSFQTKLTAIAMDCGVAMRISTVSALELDQRARADSMRQFNPDTVLTITRTGGTKDQYGALIHAIYDARLTEVRTNAAVWRANMDFRRGAVFSLAQRAEALAVDLTNKMKEDQIIRSCAIIMPKT